MGKQDGVVIIAVLWVCALVMWFALQIGSETRLQGEEQVHLFRRSQALYLAVGGAYEALARMGRPPATGLNEGFAGSTFGARRGQARGGAEDWLPDGNPHLLQYDTGEAIVVIEDENRKVNVNRANSEQLKAVFERVGLETDTAFKLADMIVDFIDKDDIPKMNGAEKDRYKQMGLPYGPFNGPLLSLDQLLLIPGISQQLFYGFGRTVEDNGGSDTEIPPDPVFPPKYSLFQMLTVYGNNTRLHDSRLEEEMLDRVINWQNGGIYRILSCGRARNGPPAVLLWLTVRNSPETQRGYEVLHRRIL